VLVAVDLQQGLMRLAAAEPKHMTKRGSAMIHRLLKDEGGQTMLEYVVIVVFVVIVMFFVFKLVKGIVARSTVKASKSIEQ
jgi:Flp pilus assembly pilin Flp